MRELDWLARLIAHPTISSAGNLELIHELRDALVRCGGACEIFPDETGKKASVLARFGPDRPDGLMLSAHLDVVPVVGQPWTRDPFTMTVDEGKLFGRGCADMKGFVACVMALAERLDGAALSRPLRLALSYDEEIGCVGVRPMLAEMAKGGLCPDLVVVGEPTSMRIGLGHKGKTAYHAHCRGSARHSAEAPLALNALHLACDMVAGLRNIQAGIERCGAREGGYSIPYSTVHAGVLNAGSAVNVVPARADLVFETRYPASEDVAALDAAIRQLASDLSHAAGTRSAGCGIELTVATSYPALAVDQNEPALVRFAACLPPESETCRLSFGTEGGLFAQALEAPVVICGPGDMAQGHQPDEFIAQSELEKCVVLLDKVVAEFCAVR